MLKVSSRVKSIALDLKQTLLQNQAARANYRALSDIEQAAKELTRFCLYSADKAGRISAQARRFYSNEASQTQADERDACYRQMLELTSHIERAASLHEEKGN
ncbi:hypothetical protein [Marinobacterium aestuariivivens]|uniref:Four helix bundle protein n=1 Tax=Marinobacterium aestuariivivens TaxID=1698799 RepID=A0ABW1ZVT1_9GAMM